MRLIDADKLKWDFNVYIPSGVPQNFVNTICNMVNAQPTIVEIVRCQNCKYWVCIEHEGMQHTACKLSENPRAPEYLYHPSAKDFCSRGERGDL